MRLCPHYARDRPPHPPSQSPLAKLVFFRGSLPGAPEVWAAREAALPLSSTRSTFVKPVITRLAWNVNRVAGLEPGPAQRIPPTFGADTASPPPHFALPSGSGPTRWVNSDLSDSTGISEPSRGFLGWLLRSVAYLPRALVNAANGASGVEERRSLPGSSGIALSMILGLTLFVGALALVVLSLGTGRVLQSMTGLPDIFIGLWNKVRWVIAFLTLALDLLYYMAPDLKLPFRWVTPGGFAATLLIILARALAGAALNPYLVYLGRYDQLYGQVGTLIVMMLWL